MNDLWPNNFPKELYLILREHLSSLEYLRLLNSSKKIFEKVKFETRKIFLYKVESEQFLSDEDYKNNILKRIDDCNSQLYIQSKDARVLQIPKCEISITSSTFTYVKDLSPLLSNRSYVELNLWNNEFAEDSFSDLQNIRKMNLLNFPEIQDIAPLANLQQLTLSNFPHLVNVSFLWKLSKLTLIDCHSISDISHLGNISCLTIINCSGVSDISGLTANKSLTIEKCPNIIDFIPMFNAKRLQTDLFKATEFAAEKVESLYLSHLEQNEFIYLYLPFQHLQCLSLTSSFVLTHLRGCSNIPIIRLCSCPSLRDISDLKPANSFFTMENLNEKLSSLYFRTPRRVTIIDCNRIEDFSSLKNVLDVKIIDCENFRNGYDVENVHSLSLNNCSNLRNVFPLGKIQNLTMMNMNIRSATLMGLSKIPKITLLHCNIPSLEGIGENLEITLSPDIIEQDINSTNNITSSLSREKHYLRFEDKETGFIRLILDKSVQQQQNNSSCADEVETGIDDISYDTRTSDDL
jgi:hypothetical protein